MLLEIASLNFRDQLLLTSDVFCESSYLSQPSQNWRELGLCSELGFGLRECCGKNYQIVSKCCWNYYASRLAQHRVLTNSQFLKEKPQYLWIKTKWGTIKWGMSVYQLYLSKAGKKWDDLQVVQGKYSLNLKPIKVKDKMTIKEVENN